MKITNKDYPSVVRLMKSAYPEYTGRKFRMEVCDHEFETHSYWDGGTRTTYTFVRADGKMMEVDSMSAPWEQYKENRKAKLVPGLACVEHTIFCGHDVGLTIMFHPDDMPKTIEYKHE
jgi:hypothetical protein